MKTETYSYRLPRWSVVYIVNNDRSDISDEEESQVDNFLAQLPAGSFDWGNAEQQEFCVSNDICNEGGECVDVKYIVFV